MRALTVADMTAEVLNLFPTGGDADDLVRKSIRAFMAFNGLSVEQLAPMTDMSVATLYRKLAGQGAAQAFKAGEVATVAHALRVDVATLYAGITRPWSPPSGPGAPGAAGPGFGATPGYLLNAERPLAAVA